jgi:adenine-specific DNA methylase
VVLDMFSGRGIIPLEAARAGATAVGTDLSPVATLAGRLLGDYALRDWSNEPPLPFNASAVSNDASAGDEEDGEGADDLLLHVASTEPRLLTDVRTVLAEIGRRVAAEVAVLYPGNPARGGAVPWAYLWAVTIPCDGCRRRFPLVGSMVLRHPYQRTRDDGQAMRLHTDGDRWRIQIHDGFADQTPTLAAPVYELPPPAHPRRHQGEGRRWPVRRHPAGCG